MTSKKDTMPNKVIARFENPLLSLNRLAFLQCLTELGGPINFPPCKERTIGGRTGRVTIETPLKDPKIMLALVFLA